MISCDDCRSQSCVTSNVLSPGNVNMGANVSITKPSYTVGRGIAVKVHGDMHRPVHNGVNVTLKMRCSLDEPHTDADKRNADEFLRGPKFREGIDHLLYARPGQRIASEMRLGISEDLSDRVLWKLMPQSVVTVVQVIKRPSWVRDVTFTLRCYVIEGGEQVCLYHVAALMAGSLAWGMQVSSFPVYSERFNITATCLDVQSAISATPSPSKPLSPSPSSTPSPAPAPASARARATDVGACVASSLAKYINRPGPPFPANLCQGMKKTGNDGATYTTVSNQRGVHRWTKA